MSFVANATVLNVASGELLAPQETYNSFRQQLLLFAQRYAQSIIRQAASAEVVGSSLSDHLREIQEVVENSSRDMVRYWSDRVFKIIDTDKTPFSVIG